MTSEKKNKIKKQKFGRDDVLDGKTLYNFYRHTTKLIK
tara:strand:- start:698 stop:811 length:114 start_codon:yes stop_codon:yes gene_type:complete